MTRHRDTTASGYVLVTVLLLGSLICLTAGTYARHALVGSRASSASLWVQETREAADSALAFARGLAACGQDAFQGRIDAGGREVGVALSDLGSGRCTLRIDATHGGLGTTLVAEAGVLGAVGDGLPRLSPAAVTAVLRDPDRTELSGTRTVADQVLDGTVVLARGSHVTLRDVVVKGPIVSEPALSGPPYAAFEATTLDLQGSVRVDGGLLLPGCAIVLPDGTLTVDGAAAVELHGAVLADAVRWHGGGALVGPFASASPASLPESLDRPGHGRGPLAWPEALLPTGWTFTTLAFPRADASAHEEAAIKGFAFGRTPR